MKHFLIALFLSASIAFGTQTGFNTPGDNYNYVRNGGWWFAQRQAPGTLTTYSNTSGRAFSADGWAITNENASAQYQRTDTSGATESGLQAQYYGQFTKITSTGKLVISQCIEGLDTDSLRGQTVRVQCWMKQIVASAPVVRMGLIQLNSSGTVDTLPATYISAFGANGTDPTLGTNLAYIAPNNAALDNCTVSGNAASCTLSASWQRFGATFAIPSNCKNLIVSFWGNNQFAATNGFAIAQVSVTIGPDVTDWMPQPYPDELQRCQRFYFKTFNIDTNPVQNAGAGTGEFRFMAGVAGATAQFGWIQFPVHMRVAPVTVTTYNPAAANAQVRDITAAGDCSAVGTSVGTESGIMCTATGNASTAVGNKLGLHLTIDSDL